MSSSPLLHLLPCQTYFDHFCSSPSFAACEGPEHRHHVGVSPLCPQSLAQSLPCCGGSINKAKLEEWRAHRGAEALSCLVGGWGQGRLRLLGVLEPLGDPLYLAPPSPADPGPQSHTVIYGCKVMVTSHRSEGGWPGLAGPQMSWLCFHYPVRGAKCPSKPSEKVDASLHTAGHRRLGGGGSCPDVTTGFGTQGGVGGPMFSVTEEHRLCCLADGASS